jgi:stearoyl-CoA desaturase (delta-9 desaturase)
MEAFDEAGGLNSVGMRIHNYLIFVAALISVIGIIYGWPYTQGIHFFLFVILFFLPNLGITVGFHRYFTHRSFKCKPWFAYFLLIMGTLSVSGPLLQWVRTHRRHHHFVDELGDPHSPNLERHPYIRQWRNFWHAHMGWLLTDFKPNRSIGPQDEKLLAMVNHSRIAQHSFAYYSVIIIGICIPGVIAGLWTHSWEGAGVGIIWGGFLRIVLMLNAELGVNSFCHVFGKRTYDTKDNSRDNWLWAILSVGEGWHNSHHRYPYSARHGLKWWQIDISYYVICVFMKCGVIWDVKLPR